MERSLGASKGVLSRAISNGTDIQSKWIQILVENYPLYSSEWLLTGTGNMLKSDLDKPIEAHKRSTEPPKSSNKRRGIPLIPIDAVAGFPSADNDGVYMEDCEHYSIPEFEAKGANFLIRVSGDSMHPSMRMATSSLAVKFPTYSSSNGVASTSSTPVKVPSSSV